MIRDIGYRLSKVAVANVGNHMSQIANRSYIVALGCRGSVPDCHEVVVVVHCVLVDTIVTHCSLSTAFVKAAIETLPDRTQTQDVVTLFSVVRFS